MSGKKVALLFICLNQPYWPYVKDVIEDCNKYFLTNRKSGHKVDYFLWTDIPEDKGNFLGATIIPTDPAPWPTPTLMRYHLFLNEEEKLKDYDYIFYLDADMRVVSFIGDEILGDGLTGAQHPMYALKRHYWFPYEANPESTAFINTPGKLTQPEGGMPLFQPLYYAGGFQGGKAKEFIKAMKVMKENIDKDFLHNYIARWNDESHWNKYLADNPPAVVLSPSYVYPDSLINEYYIPLWGCDYEKKIITLTKPFTVSKEGGEAVSRMLDKPAQIAPAQKPPIVNNGIYQCPICKDTFSVPGQEIVNVGQCNGSGKEHQLFTKPK